MDKETLTQKIKKFIAALGWRLFIWGNDTTEERYWREIYEQEKNREEHRFLGGVNCRCINKPGTTAPNPEHLFQTIDGVNLSSKYKDEVYFTKKSTDGLFMSVCSTFSIGQVMNKKEYYVFAWEVNARKFVESNNRRFKQGLSKAEEKELNTLTRYQHSRTGMLSDEEYLRMCQLLKKQRYATENQNNQGQ